MDEAQITLKVGDLVEVVNTGEYIVGRVAQLVEGTGYIRLDRKFQNSITLKITKKV